uniref:Uncharacterized protein n=1 Tax=viral metagenome TaxID=1070528 RepID=A0A6C0I2Q5_9ZZZZ
MSQQDNNASTRMEFNGIPLYVKSDVEKGIPYLYDVDTNEHVGYWCQKKGVYVMFSPYEQILNNLKRSMREELRNSGGKLKEEEEESKADEEKEEDEEEEEEEEEGTLYPTSTIFKLFVFMFVYIMFQKYFQFIYIDFIFAFAFTILYTKIVKTTLCVDL